LGERKEKGGILMEIKFGIGDAVWVLFKVNEINITGEGVTLYNLQEVSAHRKGLNLMNKREEELIPANFKEEYDVESGMYRTTVWRVVEPEEKRGKWINSERCDGVELIKCNNCKEIIAKNVSDPTGWRIVANVNPKYCPWCGAKMKEESEVENDTKKETSKV
jgi:hypothetical protein